MSIVLYRVDERLIHGQVVVGWGRCFHPRRIIVVHDTLAESPSEQDIYRCGVTEQLDIEFWTVDQAVERLPGEAESEEPVFVLTEDLESMWKLHRGGVPIREVNLGGLYAGGGRRRLLPYVYLGRDDERWVRKLEREGVRVSAQDLPSSDSVRVVEVEK